MNKTQSLKQIQTWMQTVLVSRGDLPQKLQKATQASNLTIEDVITSKSGASPYQRLDIYAAGYVLRLVDCLKSDFPGLLAFLGTEMFELFAKAYIVTQPPSSWSLFHLGNGFATFLKSTRPESASGIPEVFLELPAEIATFERAKSEVMYAQGIENLSHSPEPFTENHLFLMQQIVQTPTCVRLLEQNYPVPSFLKQLGQDANTLPPSKETTFIGISRQNYQLLITTLKPWQYAFLKAASTPIAITEACQKAATQCSLESGTLLARLFVWLPVAQSTGLIQLH